MPDQWELPAWQLTTVNVVLPAIMGPFPAHLHGESKMSACVTASNMTCGAMQFRSEV